LAIGFAASTLTLNILHDAGQVPGIAVGVAILPKKAESNLAGAV